MTTPDLVLLAYILLIVPAMLVGFFFARRKMFEPYHKLTMTTITLVNWALIILVMLATYRRDVAPQVPQNLSHVDVLIPMLHLLPGLIAQLLATYLVIRMWFERQLPDWFKVKNIKIYMRTTLALWLITALMGALTWAVINKGLFATADPGAAASTAQAGTVVIRLVKGNQFDPAEISVPAGTTVQFVNADTRSHTVTADDGSFNSGELKPAATFTHTFDQPGDVSYYCDFHGGKGHNGMSAVIHVTGTGSASVARTEEATKAVAVAPTKAPTAAPTATSAAAGNTASVVTVSMLDDHFDPAEITVPVGATVRWVNKGTHKHTATADDGSFTSGQLKAGDSFEHTFDKAGNVALYCENHGDKGGVDMAMVIHVSNSAASTPAVAHTEEATTQPSVAQTEEATHTPTLAPTLAAAVPLIARADDTPKHVSYVDGMQSQWTIVKAQVAAIKDSLGQGHYEDAQANAEAILNVFSGGAGKDWDTDGTVQQPGDGYGLQNYIFGINEAAGTVQSAATGSAKAAAADMLAMGQSALKDIAVVNQQAQALLAATTLRDARAVDLATAISKLDGDISMIADDATALGK